MISVEIKGKPEYFCTGYDLINYIKENYSHEAGKFLDDAMTELVEENDYIWSENERIKSENKALMEQKISLEEENSELRKQIIKLEKEVG